MVFLHYKWTFYFVLHHRRTIDTKLTPSRLQQTVVIKYERHAAYERINAKTGKHGKTKKQFATTLYVSRDVTCYHTDAPSCGIL